MPEIFQFVFSSDGGGGHFEYGVLAELAVTFERYIGAKFSLKWFRLSNQSRKKCRKRMVTESTKMTLLLLSNPALTLLQKRPFQLAKMPKNTRFNVDF